MENLASYIDHTLLKADSRRAEFDKLCQEAKTHQFFSVCVNSYWVPTCAQLLTGSDVKVCTVVGFPLGASNSTTKAWEADWAIKNGAGEIDMVINIGALKDKDHAFVESDIKTVVNACQGHTLKVIIETCLLTDDEKVSACKIIEAAGAQFVKTSTGFSTAGAQLNDIVLFKKNLSKHMQIKASGGIKNKAQALEFIQAGANRLGTSSGVSLVHGMESKSSY
ncbi:MAG: deoxyribose-phosphate aldolase [Bdellovibrionaceae bacterium]|nr:deoxyribose-phosphate aldolase [Pseudobdellovibrionaceae bacterium]